MRINYANVKRQGRVGNRKRGKMLNSLILDATKDSYG